MCGSPRNISRALVGRGPVPRRFSPRSRPRPLLRCWWISACLLAAPLTARSEALPELEAARTPALERAVIALARDAIALHLRERRVLAAPEPLPRTLSRPAGVFVSLGREGRDRGCRGTLEPTRPNLAAEIIHSAIAAATEDDRFSPIAIEELPRLDIFVSVVRDLRSASAPSELAPAMDGLAVFGPRGVGVLLPGEARTAAWQWRECCRRAGVSSVHPGAGAPKALRFRTVLFRSSQPRR